MTALPGAAGFDSRLPTLPPRAEAAEGESLFARSPRVRFGAALEGEMRVGAAITCSVTESDAIRQAQPVAKGVSMCPDSAERGRSYHRFEERRQ